MSTPNIFLTTEDCSIQLEKSIREMFRSLKVLVVRDMFGIEMRQWCKEVDGKGSDTFGGGGRGGGGGEREGREEQRSLNFHLPRHVLLISTSNPFLFKIISLNLMFPPSQKSHLPWNSCP